MDKAQDTRKKASLTEALNLVSQEAQKFPKT